MQCRAIDTLTTYLHELKTSSSVSGVNFVVIINIHNKKRYIASYN